jgi:hypothetical protein
MRDDFVFDTDIIEKPGKKKKKDKIRDKVEKVDKLMKPKKKYDRNQKHKLTAY